MSPCCFLLYFLYNNLVFQHIPLHEFPTKAEFDGRTGTLSRASGGTFTYNSGIFAEEPGPASLSTIDIYNALATRQPTQVKNYIYETIDKYKLRTSEGFYNFRQVYNETPIEKRNPIDLLILQKFLIHNSNLGVQVALK